MSHKKVEKTEKKKWIEVHVAVKWPDGWEQARNAVVREYPGVVKLEKPLDEPVVKVTDIHLSSFPDYGYTFYAEA